MQTHALSQRLAPQGTRFAKLTRMTFEDDCASLLSRSWSKLDHPIRLRNGISVVLYHDYRVALINETMQTLQE
jgi:hypothetical protein